MGRGNNNHPAHHPVLGVELSVADDMAFASKFFGPSTASLLPGFRTQRELESAE